MKTVFFPNIALNALWEDQETYWNTRSHVEEDKNGYYLQVDVPGFSREDLKISVEDRELRIEGERKGKFAARLRKAFSLPDDVDLEKVAAQTRDGVLELALPKVPATQPKTISIAEGKDSFFQLEKK